MNNKFNNLFGLKNYNNLMLLLFGLICFYYKATNITNHMIDIANILFYLKWELYLNW